jgi:hypothetical protein
VNRSTLSTFAVIASLSLLSCGLIFEFPDSSGIEYYPRVENQILTTGENPHIRFDFEADRDSVLGASNTRYTGSSRSTTW